MDKNQVKSIIKSIKEKVIIVSIFSFAIISALLFLIEYPIKYVLAATVFIIGLTVISKKLNAKYLLYDECNPQLYYAVVSGTLKQVPIDMQAVVAEFIGDYSSAVQISGSLSANSKSSLVKLNSLINISRNAFLAGDYGLCLKALDEFNIQAHGRKINRYQLVRNEFYKAYINGDFAKAKDLLTELKNSVKKTRKSFDCQMLYYNAIVNRSLGDIQTANAQFESIISDFPNMYLAEKAKRYLNGSADEINELQINETEALLPKLSKQNKKDLIKGIICIAVLIVCVAAGIGSISNNAQDTPEQAIEEYDNIAVSSIKGSIKVDNEHTVVLYENDEKSLGVAYLIIKDDKYICKIANCDNYNENYSESNWAKMHVSGKTSEILYKWLSSSEEAPEDFEIIAIEYNNKTVYFCYKFNAAQRYYSDLYSIDF